MSVVPCLNKNSPLYSQVPPSGWFSVVPAVAAPSPYNCGGSLPALNSSAPPSQTHLAQAPQQQPSLQLHPSVPLQQLAYQQSLLQQQIPQAPMTAPTHTYSLQQTQPLAPLSHSTPQNQPLLPSQVPTPQVSLAVPLLPGSAAHIESSANTGGTFCSSSSSPFSSAAALPSSAKIHPNPPTSILPLGQK